MIHVDPCAILKTQGYVLPTKQPHTIGVLGLGLTGLIELSRACRSSGCASPLDALWHEIARSISVHHFFTLL